MRFMLKDVPALIAALPGQYTVLSANDPDFTIVAVTDMYALAMRRSREQLVGRNFFAALLENPADKQNSTENITHCFREAIKTKVAQSITKVKFDVRTSGGEYEARFWSSLCTPVVDESGRVKFLIYAIKDITDQAHGSQSASAKELRDVNEELELRVKERTAQLELMNANLERSNRELQDFAYVASHDLQEPLRKIQAFGNLLEEEFGAALGEGRTYLERMRSAASRMSVLIEDLLAFSRITTQARPFSTVNLQEVAEEVVGDLETRLAQTGGKVQVRKLPTIKADALQMRQLLQNLIANGLKFHREGVPPKVTVSAAPITSKRGRTIAYNLQVADNGIGFDEKYLDRIFAVFQRLHGNREYQGTGIGLAVCRKIAERHHGRITAISRLGKGSTFTVSLPVHPSKKGGLHA